jgi:hypothetical protein
MASRDIAEISVPRQLRPVPDPLGLFIRAGRNDQAALLDLVARGDAQFFGVVIDAPAVKRQKELRERISAARMDVILDPRTQPCATLGGRSAEIAKLPWALPRAHVPSDFEGDAGRRRIEQIGAYASEYGFTQVIAPTHLLIDGHDPWLEIDVEATKQLRSYLNRSGHREMQILYSLAIPYSVLRDDSERDAIIDALKGVPADAIWLRVDGLGRDATANAVRNYIQGTADFQRLELPIIADGLGGLAGLSQLAFGAVGGIAHGVTFGERVDTSSWKRPRTQGGFGPSRGVYLPDLDLMVEPAVVRQILDSSTRAKSLLGCRDTRCCPRGLVDMTEDPARHFLVQRMKQLAAIGRVPRAQRASAFVEEFVRPASDSLVQATNWKSLDPDLLKKLNRQRRRIDALRIALVEDLQASTRQPAQVPKTRRARDHRAGI